MIKKYAKTPSALGSWPRGHRRTRICPSLLLTYYIRGIGDRLYYLGCITIRAQRNALRALRRWAKGAALGFSRSLRRFGKTVGRAMESAASDVATPFEKANRSFKSLSVVMKSTSDRSFSQRMHRLRMFFKYGWLWNKHLVFRLCNYLLPAACLVVCVTVILSMVNLNYALEVNYNGEMIGYVTDEAVFDSAKKIIKSRMVTTTDDTNWDRGASLNIAVVEKSELSTEDIMAESLLSVSGTEIAEATGLYVGGTFYGATTARTLLEEDLNAVLQPYLSQASSLGGDVTVKFARDVELVDGIYPVASILPYEQLRDSVTSGEARDIYYKVSAGDTAAAIAKENGISTDRLTELNAGVNLEALSDGETLLVATGEPLLSVKTVKYSTYTEAVAFTTTITRDSRFNEGYYWIVTQGESGEKTITEEIEYTDGVETSTTVVSEEVTKQPVSQEVIVGSKPGSDGATVSVGTGTLTWPTGEGYKISRGFSSYHFGIDIANVYGTPIYAADNGVVTYTAITDVGYGIYIIIDHQNGMQTVYGHLSALLVETGDVVSRGDLIGLMGSTGNSTGSHLHFETRIDGVKMDPAIYLYGLY
ncbi:MAG: M23 family metallopeptidase [Oscillospiraceae bacterium]|nr:M23 family metallopeptidase [Oscillospiraceae bacterium]